MMQYFMYLLVLVWTMLFGFIFFRLFPDATDRIVSDKNKHVYNDIQDPGDRPLPPCDPSPSMPKKEIPEIAINDQPVPIDENSPSVNMKIQNQPELNVDIPKIEKETLDKKMSSALENRLIQILVKMNLAACPNCSPDDKRVVLQLKMMKAFLDGRPKEAEKYSDELDKYIKTKKMKDKKPKQPNVQIPIDVQ